MKPTPLALAIALATLPAISSAQMLEEVVVTAQKKAETLTEAPVAVTLVSGQDINDLSIFQADELSKLVTGMEVRYEGDNNTGVGMRGVGTFTQQTAPARVGTYMDDYYMAAQAAVALASMFDMANVQALKGPQGTLYGQPSPTGALILTTQDPNFDGVNGHIQGSIVDPKGYNIQGAINVPIGDTFAARLAVLDDERETGVVNPVRGDDEERNRTGYRVKLLWEPTDSLALRFGYHSLESKSSHSWKVMETIDPELANFDDLRDKDRTAINDAPQRIKKKEDTLVTFKLDWAIGDVDLTWFSGALESDQHLLADDDQTDVPASTLEQFTIFGGASEGQQHELRLSGSAFDNWDWVVGAYYGVGEAVTDVDLNFDVGGVSVFNLFLNLPTNSKTKAVFTHNAFHFGSDTELTVGVRYNEFSRDNGNTTDGTFLLGAVLEEGGNVNLDGLFTTIPNAFPCPDGTLSPCTFTNEATDKEWTGTVKLRHFFSEGFNLYGTLDRGFRPGAPNFDLTGVLQPDFLDYDGESVNSIEIGAKGDVLDGRARYSAAFFYSVYDDYQVPVNFTAWNNVTNEEEIITTPPFLNVDEAVQTGIEADFRMMVTENWMVYTGFTYTNVEFTDGEIPCTDPSQPPVSPENRFNTCDADGETASPQPEWTAIAQTEYTFPQLIGSSDAYIGALFNYRGDVDVPGDPAGNLSSDSFTNLDLFTGLRSESWTLQLFVKNALDEDGVLARRPINEAYNELVMQPERTVGITASYNF